jgi:hypothetical protein
MRADARTRRASAGGDDTAAAAAASTAAVAGAWSRAEVQRAIVRIYEQHHQHQRLASVPQLLATHAGREEELLRKVVAKYEGSSRACSLAPKPDTRTVTTVPPKGGPAGRQTRAAAVGMGGRNGDGGGAEVLPPELLAMCVQHLLSAADAGRCACVCRAWRSAASTNSFWGRLYGCFFDGEAAQQAGEEHEGDDSSAQERAKLGCGPEAGRAAPPGGWRVAFQQRWLRRCEQRAVRWLAHMQRASYLTSYRPARTQGHRGGRSHAAQLPDCWGPTAVFGSLRQAAAALELRSFELRLNGGAVGHTVHALGGVKVAGARGGGGGGGGGGEGSQQQRQPRRRARDCGRQLPHALSLSLRCPAEALEEAGGGAPITRAEELHTVELSAHSATLGRRFVVWTAQCRQPPPPPPRPRRGESAASAAARRAQGGGPPGPAAGWRRAASADGSGVELYELPCGGGGESGGGGGSVLSMLTFHEPAPGGSQRAVEGAPPRGDNDSTGGHRLGCNVPLGRSHHGRRGAVAGGGLWRVDEELCALYISVSLADVLDGALALLPARSLGDAALSRLPTRVLVLPGREGGTPAVTPAVTPSSSAVTPSASASRGAVAGAGAEDEVAPMCCICWQPLADGEAVFALGCRHTQHRRCLAQWLRVKASCPECRAPVAPPTFVRRPGDATLAGGGARGSDGGDGGGGCDLLSSASSSIWRPAAAELGAGDIDLGRRRRDYTLALVLRTHGRTLWEGFWPALDGWGGGGGGGAAGRHEEEDGGGDVQLRVTQQALQQIGAELAQFARQQQPAGGGGGGECVPRVD